MSGLKTAPEFNVAQNRNVLNELEITTELALPFILCGEDKDKDLLEFIIVDDIIIHGSTLRNISNCLYYITNRIPYVSCIALHEKASIPKSVNVQNLMGMKHLSQQEVDEFVKTVAYIVETTQLPIDLEFPIFRTESDITSDEAERKWNELSKIKETNSCASYQVGKLNNRICIIPKTGNFNIYVPDFTKFRFYKKEDDAGKSSHILLEVFAPAILNEYLLTSTNQELCTADKYSELWKNTTLDIRKKIAELRNESGPESFDVVVNFTRSLCVWANYILSFSYYKFYKSKLESEQGLKDILKGYEISQENLRLILGYDIANKVIKILNSILESSVDMNFVQQVSGKVPDSFAPEELEQMLNTLKGHLYVESKQSRNILIQIIDFQHYSNEIFSKAPFCFKKLFFGETYVSLIQSLSPFEKLDDKYIFVNDWVDESIDSGVIVPKYERIKLEDGAIVWRRYFHVGLNRKMAA